MTGMSIFSHSLTLLPRFILLPIQMTGHRRLQMVIAVSNATIKEVMRFGPYYLVFMARTTDGIQWMILSQLFSLSEDHSNDSCCTALRGICCGVGNAITFLCASQGIKVTAIVRDRPLSAIPKSQIWLLTRSGHIKINRGWTYTIISDSTAESGIHCIFRYSEVEV